jgi:hypothetical protein
MLHRSKNVKPIVRCTMAQRLGEPFCKVLDFLVQLRRDSYPGYRDGVANGSVVQDDVQK